MAKAIWKGALTMGFVTIPVALYAATEEKTIKFNLLHGDDGGRIQYKRVCASCNDEVEWGDIVKGYPVGEQFVTFEDHELETDITSVKAVEITAMVDAEEIDPMMLVKPYYMLPDPTGAKAYKVIMRAMLEAGTVGLAKVTLRQKEHPVMLRVVDGTIVLSTMRWPDELREPENLYLGAVSEPTKKELDMARQFIDTLVSDYDPSEFQDEYRMSIEALVDKKIQGVEIKPAKKEKPLSGAGDLMTALEASVKAAKDSKGKKKPTKSRSHTQKTNAIKAPGKKATSKKKTTAKKTTARRARKAAG